MENTPLIFDIRHFALDDGPGIRTTVFLKGCPLSCSWCHNPEGINTKSEIMFSIGKCIFCGNCMTVCHKNAIDMEKENRIIHSKCDRCGLCISECPSGALRTSGKYYSPEDLCKELLSDRIFYQTSSGGVTFSGGEPTMFMDYLKQVLRILKENDIHTAIQTSGVFDYEKFREKLLPYLDLVFFDIKLIDSGEYRRWTGGDVALALKNFRLLCKQDGVNVTASVPLIPGITDTGMNLTAIRDLIYESGCRELVFRPYHPGGISKNISLGRKVPGNVPVKGMTAEEEQKAKRVFNEERIGEMRLT
jgi:pyruvate formate lyase activating enzyme